MVLLNLLPPWSITTNARVNSADFLNSFQKYSFADLPTQHLLFTVIGEYYRPSSRNFQKSKNGVTLLYIYGFTGPELWTVGRLGTHSVMTLANPHPQTPWSPASGMFQGTAEWWPSFQTLLNRPISMQLQDKTTSQWSQNVYKCSLYNLSLHYIPPIVPKWGPSIVSLPPFWMTLFESSLLLPTFFGSYFSQGF